MNTELSTQQNKIIELHTKQHLSPKQIKNELCLSSSEYQVRSFLVALNCYCAKNKPIDWHALVARVKKDEFTCYFCEHSRIDTMSHFSLSAFEFKYLIKTYNYKKDKDKINDIRVLSCKKKYGCDNVSQSKEVNDRIKNTFLKKYGADSFLKTSEFRKKADATLIKKYGTLDNARKHIAESNKKTCLEKYGTSYNNNREKYKHTLIARYGSIENAYKNIIDVKKKNAEEKYGSWKKGSLEILKKSALTNEEKYGYSFPLKSDTVRNKCKQTLMKRYGVDNPSKIGSVQKKISQKVSEYVNNTVMKDYTNEFKTLYHSKDKSIAFFKSENKQFSYPQLTDRFNCPLNAVIYWVHRYCLTEYIKNDKSKPECEIISFLKSIVSDATIVHNDRHSLKNGQEIDIYLPEYKIGIEFNGTYWHSAENVGKNYHFDKSKLAESLGIRLIHIYEHEWNDPIMKEKIKSLLKIALGVVPTKIYARECDVKQITNKEAKPFNEANHLQGHRNAQVTYGLFYKNELVQLMSFSKTRYNRNLKDDNAWEIIRGCPGSNNIVVGGVSRLFSHFVNDYHPCSVFSYCDFNKFDGKGYEAIGMKFVGYTGPDMSWIINRQVVKRKPSMHAEYKKMAEGQLYGAGSKKYLWKANDL